MTDNSRYIYDALYGEVHLDDYLWIHNVEEDFWDIFRAPELQRLREVRLCNINSLFLPGGANINRFEHALGTYHLAVVCLQNWPPLDPLPPEEQKRFLIAALIHDLKTSPFGHSVEYVEEKEGFEHEGEIHRTISGQRTTEGYQYWSSQVEQIFANERPALDQLLSDEDLGQIDDYIQGKGRLGPLISSDMDLDNIDNIFRMGHHIGLINPADTPIKLAKALSIKDGEKFIKEENLELVEDWYEARVKLYTYLLLNPGEFAGKCMLTEALEFTRMQQNKSFSWKDVDYELIQGLWDLPPVKKEILRFLFVLEPTSVETIRERKVTPEIVEEFSRNDEDITEEFDVETDDDGILISNQRRTYHIIHKFGKYRVYKESIKSYDFKDKISRLMLGDLYGCLSIVSVTSESYDDLINFYEEFQDTEIKLNLDEELTMRLRHELKDERPSETLDQYQMDLKPRTKYSSLETITHLINDIAKTHRQVRVRTENEDEVFVGRNSKRILVGVFAKNKNFDIYSVDNLPQRDTQTIENVITDFLTDVASGVADNPTIKPLPLYDEVTYG